MLITFLIPLLFFLVALCALAWYQFKYKPEKEVKTLIAQGASDLKFEENPNDMLYGAKKAIQENPDLKVVPRTLAGKVGLSFFDPNLIKEVLTNHKYYSKLNKGSELSDILNSRGITVAEDQLWKLHRKIVSEAFQYDLFNDMIPTIVETTNEVLDVSSKEQKVIRAPDDIELITSEAITRIFFGLNSGDVIINGKKASEEITSILKRAIIYNKSPIRFTLGMWIFNLLPDYRDLKKRMRNFRKVFGEKIQERMQEIKTSISENKP